MKNWKYYNHAAIPTTAPHEEVDLKPLEDGSIWKVDGGIPLLARWTSDFDCGYETNWWYVIKDTPFDISALKAKRRYEINKGKKNFFVELIQSELYEEELYQVTIQAFEGWPVKYRPVVDHDSFIKSVKEWSNNLIYGAFSNETKMLCGYAFLTEYEKHIDFSMLRTIPAMEKNGINAAIVEKILTDYQDNLQKGNYICDGCRSIRHETAFQDYLEKYFGFRKAYCKLNVKYRKVIGGIVECLYLIRNFLKKIDNIGVVHQINAIIKMEEIIRE